MRMFHGIPVCICLACFLAAASSAQTVAPISDQTKELKRTAHILHTTVDRLKNARAALKEATDLARHSTDDSALRQLSQDWVRIDKARAPDALEDLYGWLRTTARDAPNSMIYGSCRRAAQSMLQNLATLDPDRAVSLWRMWPDPPAALGLSSAQDGEFEKQLATGDSEYLGMLKQQAAQGSYYAAGRLASQLNQSGDWAEAVKVVDRAMAGFNQGAHDPLAISSYFNFVDQLPSVDPDRYVQALSALMPSLSKLTGPNDGGTLTVGSQTLKLTAAEAGAIALCQSVARNSYADLTIKTLDTVPGLKIKLDGIGGIDIITGHAGGIMNPSQIQVSMSLLIDGKLVLGIGPVASPAANDPRPFGSTFQSAELLYGSLRYKFARDPALVTKTLADAAKTPDQIDVLIRVANDASSPDPDLASLALEFASQLVMQVEPLSKRAAVMQQLIQAYQHCEGEVEADLLQEGRLVVQQLRDEQKRGAAPIPAARGPVPVSGTMADQLEILIVTQQALDNFDGAMKDLRLMPDNLKLPGLLQIVQTLIQPF